MMSFLGIVFYIPVFYQNVQHTSATISGLELLPVVGGFLIFSIVTGAIIAKTGHFKSLPPIGGIIATLGFGLAYQFRPSIPQGEAVMYMLIIGIGMGCSFQNCIIIIQGSVSKELVPTATTSMSFMQNIGGVVGIAIAGTIVNTVSTNYFADHVPVLPPPPYDAFYTSMLGDIQEAAMAKGVATMFIASVPYCVLATIAALFIKNVTLSKVVGGETMIL